MNMISSSGDVLRKPKSCKAKWEDNKWWLGRPLISVRSGSVFKECVVLDMCRKGVVMVCMKDMSSNIKQTNTEALQKPSCTQPEDVSREILQTQSATEKNASVCVGLGAGFGGLGAGFRVILLCALC